MNQQPQHDWNPPPALLAAYIDGELSGAERDRVEAWLRQHPEASAFVEAQEELDSMFQATWAVKPSEVAWTASRMRVQRRIAREKRRRQRAAALLQQTPPRRSVLETLVPPAAAAAIVALLFARFPDQQKPEPVDVPAPFPILAQKEVEINSLDPADSKALVVGRIPPHAPLEPAAPSEVVVHALLPENDRMNTPPVVGEGQK
jgi:anti-sigma-K factor RskA